MAGDNGQGAGNHDRYFELIDSAEAELDRDRPEEALQLAQDAIIEDASQADGYYLAAIALVEMGSPGDALPFLENALRLDPGDADLITLDAGVRFMLGEAAAATDALGNVLRDHPDHPDAHYWLSLVLEHQGDTAEADRHLRRAVELDPESYHLPYRIDRAELEASLNRLVETLPAPIRDALQELPILIEDLPSSELLAGHGRLAPDLLGLFVGPSLEETSVFDAEPAMKAVYLFQRNLERFATSRDELIEEARITLVHEIGHYLGLEEEELHDRDLG